MKPVNAKEIAKFQRKNPSDKRLWQNLWKRMLNQDTMYRIDSYGESWNRIYAAHLNR